MRSVLPLVRVEHACAGLEHAGVDAEEGELADVRVGHDLEGQRRERLVVGGLALQLVAASSGSMPRDGRHVERGRQVVDDGIEQRLHALVLEGGAAEHRGDPLVERAPAERPANASRA